jgi:hypothetical protein
MFVDEVQPFEGMTDIMDDIKEISTSVEELADSIDPDFDDFWNNSDDKTVKKLKKFLPMFINQQVRVAGDAESIITAKDENTFMKTFRKKVIEFLTARMEKEKEGKSEQVKVNRDKDLQTFKEFLKNYDDTLDPFMRAFYRLFSIKKLYVKVFDNLAKKLGKTFVVDKENDNALIATRPEGYVLVNSPNMIKIVDRAEFSKNNMLYGGIFNEEYDLIPPTGNPESIGGGKPIKKFRSFTDEVLADVMGSLEDQKKSGFSEVEAVDNLSRTKGYNALWVGKMQPPTKAHMQALEHLAKTFHKVFLIVTPTGKYIDPELSVDLLKSAADKAGLRNVDIRLGTKQGKVDPVKSGFGLTSKYPETLNQSVQDMFDFFQMDDDDRSRTLVLAQGLEEKGKEGEEDRFGKQKKMGTLFIVNDGEEPSEEKPYGLYGIPIEREGGRKVGASQIREILSDVNGDIEQAKEMMAGGDDELKDLIIDSFKQKMEEEQKYFDINGFSVDKEIVKELSEERYIDQSEAMNLILDILSGE